MGRLPFGIKLATPSKKVSMTKRFLVTAISCFSLMFTLFSFIPPENASLVDDVLSKTNEFRQSKGLPPLTINADMNALAQKHSADMASGRVDFGHDGFSKRSTKAKQKITTVYQFAENVAYGVSTADAVLTMWKNSPGHRKNLLGNYKYIGIGIAKDKKGRMYYTQIFAG